MCTGDVDSVRREIGKSGKDERVDDHCEDVGAPTWKEQTVEKKTSKEISQCRQRHERETIGSRRSFKNGRVVSNLIVRRRQMGYRTRQC